MCPARLRSTLTTWRRPEAAVVRVDATVANVTDVASVKRVVVRGENRVDADQAAVETALETPDECGCAPSPRERRLLWPSMTRRSALGLGVIGLAAVSAFGGPLVAPAFAADYPSWPEVEAAKANEAAKAAEVAKIKGIIAAMEADLAAKQQAAQVAADEFYVAQQQYFDAALRAEQLQEQADGQAAAAVDAANKAGRVAAQLYRTGGDDTSLELFFAEPHVTPADIVAAQGLPSGQRA